MTTTKQDRQWVLSYINNKEVVTFIDIFVDFYQEYLGIKHEDLTIEKHNEVNIKLSSQLRELEREKIIEKNSDGGVKYFISKKEMRNYKICQLVTV